MLYSFGHGTLARGDLPNRLSLLRDPAATTIIDVRSHPESRWPDWNRAVLEDWVPVAYPAGYVWEPGLGGWRDEHAGDPRWKPWLAERGVDLEAYRGRFPKAVINRTLKVPPVGQADPFWYVGGFWDFQWFMATGEFQQAAWQLAETYGGDGQPDAAFFCCETLWWKCHRSMIADYLAWLGVQVVHLNGSSATAHVGGLASRLARYHSEVPAAWERFKSERAGLRVLAAVS